MASAVSSPLSSSLPSPGLHSRSFSPSINTPKRLRSPSLSFSSDSPNDNDSYDEVSDDDSASPGRKRTAWGADRYGFDPAALPTTQCQWGNCQAEFYELEPLIEHVHSVHAFPVNPADIGTKKALVYNCEWAGCPRAGKKETSKFALLGHLRSHTGEKPFNCPRPECDKSFTRTDALQKHMRTQHGEKILPSRRPPSKKSRLGGGSSNTRATSIDSVLDVPFAQSSHRPANADDDASTTFGGDDGEDGAGGEGGGGELVWTEEEEGVFAKHPGVGKGFLSYVVAKAKWAFLVGEHEGMAGEVEALGIREAEMGAECEELVKLIMRKEVGEDQTDPGNGEALETYLTRYSHRPLVPPPGVKAPGAGW